MGNGKVSWAKLLFLHHNRLLLTNTLCCVYFQGKRKDKKVVDLDNVIAEDECQDKAETKEISAIVEEISLPKAKPVVSVASLLKIPNYTTKRSEQTKSYVRQMFNEKYRKQLLRDFPFDMLDKD